MKALRPLFLAVFILMVASIVWGAESENQGGLPGIEERVNALENVQPIIWSGLCSESTQGNAVKQIYCADTVDFDTSTHYLRVESSGVFHVLRSGFYRINARALGNTSHGVRSYVDVNGETVYQDIANAAGVSGVTAKVDFIWPLYRGDEFSVFFDNYMGSYGPNDKDAGLQVLYLGPILDLFTQY